MDETHRPRGWLGPWIAAVLVTLVLAFLGTIINGVVRSWWSMFAVIVPSSIWAAWDSSRIGLQRYKSQMANEPVLVLFMCVMFWGLFFPWYLIIRQGIRRGLVPLKPPPDHESR